MREYQVRVVKPLGIIQWRGTQYRWTRTRPAWFADGAKVRVLRSLRNGSNSIHSLIVTRVGPGYFESVRCVREVDWLPEGF